MEKRLIRLLPPGMAPAATLHQQSGPDGRQQTPLDSKPARFRKSG